MGKFTFTLIGSIMGMVIGLALSNSMVNMGYPLAEAIMLVVSTFTFTFVGFRQGNSKQNE